MGKSKIDQGITEKTLSNYSLAFQKFGLAIDLKREQDGGNPFSKLESKRTSEIFRQAVLKTATVNDVKKLQDGQGRAAYPKPVELLQAQAWGNTENGLKAQLMAEVVYTYGNRISEANLIKIHYEAYSGQKDDKANPILGLFSDNQCLTRNKGGQYQLKEYVPEIADKLHKMATSKNGVLSFYVNQDTARRYIDMATKETGQYESGRGFHGLRHNCAQEFYAQCKCHGYSDEEAAKATSRYMSHHRTTATFIYVPDM